MINFIKKYLIILKIFSVTFLLYNCSSSSPNKDMSQSSDIELLSFLDSAIASNAYKRIIFNGKRIY